VSGVPFSNPSFTQIGGDSGRVYFNGKIDDARIYNRALSASEVLQLYKLGNSIQVNASQNLK